MCIFSKKEKILAQFIYSFNKCFLCGCSVLGPVLDAWLHQRTEERSISKVPSEPNSLELSETGSLLQDVLGGFPGKQSLRWGVSAQEGGKQDREGEGPN